MPTQFKPTSNPGFSSVQEFGGKTLTGPGHMSPRFRVNLHLTLEWGGRGVACRNKKFSEFYSIGFFIAIYNFYYQICIYYIIKRQN